MHTPIHSLIVNTHTHTTRTPSPKEKKNINFPKPDKQQLHKLPTVP